MKITSVSPLVLRHKLPREQFEVNDGYIQVPAAPGLGVTVDEGIVEKYLVG
jgi:L-alanine-DL-glutamate epimerase-like enolase superfamily enzyme